MAMRSDEGSIGRGRGANFEHGLSIEAEANWNVCGGMILGCGVRRQI